MSYKLNLVTPYGRLVKDLECEDLTIPTEIGQINVLPKHTHLLTQLSTGILTAKTKSEGSKHFSITYGVCKVMGDSVTVLSRISENKLDIDLDRAKEALRRAEEKLSGKEHLADVDLIKHQRKLERAKTRIELAYLK
jgi:F-type H+-transporting ATPase subunit epsilon